MQVIIDWIKRIFWQDPYACFQQMYGISDFVGCLNVIIWSEALIYLALGAGFDRRRLVAVKEWLVDLEEGEIQLTVEDLNRGVV